MKSAVFIDRDGTINEDEHGYISRPDDFILYPFAAAAISIFNKLGFYVFVTTNQSGVARGYYTFDDIHKIHAKMKNELVVGGASIDDIFVSPYHIEGHIVPYNINHPDRKPGIGMILQAQKKYSLDMANSYVIGDRSSDVEMAKNAGIKSILVRTGLGQMTADDYAKQVGHNPDYICDNLLAAANFIQSTLL